MAMDAGVIVRVVPTETTASATPAVSNQVTFVGVAVKGGFLVTEECDLVETGIVFTVAGTTTATVWKASVARDAILANNVDIPGIPVGGVISVNGTAPSTTQPLGLVVSKRYNYRLYKGDFVTFSIVTAPTAGQGYFYAKMYPAGSSVVNVAASEVPSTT